MRTARWAALTALVAAAPLAAQTNTFVAGTQFQTPGLTGFSTFGSDMTGMLVEWTFSTGGGGSAAWASLGGGFHGVSGANGFSVRMASGGNSFSSNWEVQNSSNQRLLTLRLRGASGRTLFDCGWQTSTNPDTCANTGNGDGFPGGQGTVTSADGWSMQSTGGSFTGSVFGEYANLVSVIPNAPVGDLFEQLTLTFGGGGMGAGQSYTFRADTDSSPSDRPPPTVVPEPSTYALVATGLAALAFARRRRSVA